jgi:hypothetical protein
MSAAAILSVAARKAASEGKKVGAAALTLIALVVMSLTVFPGLNRAPSDQMAEAPLNPGSSQDAGASAGTAGESAEGNAGSTDDDSGSVASGDESATDGSAEAGVDGSEGQASAAPAKVKKDPIEKVLTGPALGGIMNADSSSRVFILDQNYTAEGDSGLSAKFTFNPTSEAVFSSVVVEISLKDFVFDFKPVNPILISGKNEDGLDVYMHVGKAPFLFDEFGKKWTETEAKNATFKLEVTMERDGTTVKEIKLALYRANS